MDVQTQTQPASANGGVADDQVARIVVAGHVDHGKSTLIGRLLYDLGLLHASKIEDVLASSARRGVTPEWSYVLDSLQEERDQAITIDTTRLWFAHNGRRYMIIDAPGHRQFLANMLSGASEADAAVLVVDAQAGIGEQTLRHAYLLAFLGIKHVIVAMNKIDLLADPQPRVAELERELRAALGVAPAAVVPVSAAFGTNVSTRSETTPWYDGPTIVGAIDAIRRVPAPVERRFRLPVQDVYRRDGTRIAVGTLASGRLAAGSEILMLPAGVRVSAERLVRWPEGDVASAAAGETIGVVLDGDRFVGRGDTFVLPHEAPVVARNLALETFWLDHDGPSAGERLRLKRGTQDVPVVVDGTPGIYEIDAAREAYSSEAAQHNIVRLKVRATTPVVFDRRDDDAHGARSVLLRGDRVVAIGFTTDAVAASAAPARADAGAVTLPERERRNHHRAAVIWLTGLSGAGKSTLARGVVRRLFDRGFSVATVDGDQLRWSLNTDLGFTEADRAENVRRSAAVAGVMAEAGHIVLVSVIAPFASARAAVRASARHPFYEVFVNAPLAVCEERDPKGLYRKARSGEITSFTGIDSPYEAPEAPDLEIRTDSGSVEDGIAKLIAFIEERTHLAGGDD
ncbi:MAG: bifunctional enzyme CysN/CysC [Candidatus Eremiobacteraeota bacterium]|nr:bifunctional enzyme CysN/CysC [Candidatus Eremiobacteraeota bacterium]